MLTSEEAKLLLEVCEFAFTYSDAFNEKKFSGTQESRKTALLQAIHRETEPQPVEPPQWEYLAPDGHDPQVRRIRVHGGWLYQLSAQMGEMNVDGVCSNVVSSWYKPLFVPDTRYGAR